MTPARWRDSVSSQREARGRRSLAVWLVSVLAAACSADGSSGSGGSGRQQTPQTAIGECQSNNLTQQCSCGTQAGRQTCVGNTWSSCECATATAADGGGGTGSLPMFEGNNRSDIHFVWEHTPTIAADGTCTPGPYEGNFYGFYDSYLTVFTGSSLTVPVANIDLPGQPSGFHFTVEPAQGGETVQKIKGEMNGQADGAFPFIAKIDGELDCPKATFTATLHDGSYSVLTQGLLPQTFEGVMAGHYDKRTHTFVDGSWDVRETSAQPPGMLAPTPPRDFKRDGYGGYGKWAASLPTDLTDPKLTVCPTNYTCGTGPLGPNKLLCNGLLGTPTCLTDADCNTLFPGENITCLSASAFSLCLRECKK